MFQLMQSIDSHSIWTNRAKNNEDIRALIVFHVSVGNVRQHVLQLYRKESSTVYYYRNYALMSQSNMIRVYCSGGTDMTNTNPTTNVLIKCVNGASARGTDYYIYLNHRSNSLYERVSTSNVIINIYCHTWVGDDIEITCVVWHFFQYTDFPSKIHRGQITKMACLCPNLNW